MRPVKLSRQQQPATQTMHRVLKASQEMASHRRRWHLLRPNQTWMKENSSQHQVRCLEMTVDNTISKT